MKSQILDTVVPTFRFLGDYHLFISLSRHDLGQYSERDVEFDMGKNLRYVLSLILILVPSQ